MHNASTGVTMEFKYNHEGIRTQKVKKVNGTVTETTDYILKGKLIAMMKKNTDTYYFTYDASEKPETVNFNGANYTYVKNQQGDIVGILDASGNLVVEYKYDAWGEPVYIYSASLTCDPLAFDNPFRYRGYIWDDETYLYHIMSRYYNPEWQRFINSDSQYGRVAEHISHNLFAYCANSPIMLVDLDGQVWVMGAYAPDYGYYHREVQKWIKEHNSDIETEVVTSTGRIDLYNNVTHEIYEVKPDKVGSIAIGLIQLERYTSGDIPAVYGIFPLNLPPDGTLVYAYENTTVTVTVTQIGSMIVYSLDTKRKKKSKVTDPATVSLPIPEKNKRDSLLGATITAACFATAMIFLLDAKSLEDVRLR